MMEVLMDFKKFKANRGKVMESAKQLTDKKPTYIDDRFWELTRDQQGCGEAVIRFLCVQDESKPPVVMKMTHGFKENNKFFYIDCPSTIGKECPSCQYAQPFWDQNTEESKKIATRYSRKKVYIANILIVKDLAKPDNNGKVFLFKFGQKVFDKIIAKISPKSELDVPDNIFDLWTGKNFKLRVTIKNKYPNYDTCEFYPDSTPVGNDDDVIENIFNKIRPLDEFIDEKIFNKKSYDSILAKFISVVGERARKFFNVAADTTTSESTSDEPSFDNEKPANTKKTENTSSNSIDDMKFEETPAVNEQKKSSDNSASTENTTDTDDDFNFEGSDDDFNFDD